MHWMQPNNATLNHVSAVNSSLLVSKITLTHNHNYRFMNMYNKNNEWLSIFSDGYIDCGATWRKVNVLA